MATSNKVFPIVLVGVAALGVLVFFGMNNPPGDEVTGTVAPAERYRAEQTNEIQLGDESIQEVLQSDIFETLVNDESFRSAMQSEELRAAFSSETGRGGLELLRGTGIKASDGRVGSEDARDGSGDA
mgnify:CR=1 FL=1